MHDGGQWDMFTAIVKKYGIVPKSVYPETFQSSNTGSLNRHINNYLRATEAARPIAYNELCEYLTRTSGNLVSIGFEKQQLITHRGVVKGVAPNIGNPLYDFQHWTINLED